MNTSTEVFVIIAASFALFGALGTVLAKSPLRAAMGLLLHIVSLAGVFLAMHAQLLGVLQLLVYAGAVVVLFVFVIMLIGPSAVIPHSSRGLIPRAVGVSVMIAVTLTIASAVGHFEALPGVVPVCGPNEAGCVPFGGVEALGGAIYKGALLPFELVSITLLVAIIGAVAVARGRTAAEAESARRRKAEREAEATKKREEEERLSAEVAAHGGH